MSAYHDKNIGKREKKIGLAFDFSGDPGVKRVQV